MSRQIDLPHQDSADPFIVATAVFYQLTLATADFNLTSSSWLRTVSLHTIFFFLFSFFFLLFP